MMLKTKFSSKVDLTRFGNELFNYIDVLDLARSPDCNSIENLWDNIKQKANMIVKDDTSLGEFQRIWQSAWANLDQRRIQTLINTMLKRCREVIIFMLIKSKTYSDMQ